MIAQHVDDDVVVDENNTNTIINDTSSINNDEDGDEEEASSSSDQPPDFSSPAQHTAETAQPHQAAEDNEKAGCILPVSTIITSSDGEEKSTDNDSAASQPPEGEDHGEADDDSDYDHDNDSKNSSDINEAESSSSSHGLILRHQLSSISVRTASATASDDAGERFTIVGLVAETNADAAAENSFAVLPLPASDDDGGNGLGRLNNSNGNNNNYATIMPEIIPAGSNSTPPERATEGMADEDSREDVMSVRSADSIRDGSTHDGDSHLALGGGGGGSRNVIWLDDAAIEDVYRGLEEAESISNVDDEDVQRTFELNEEDDTRVEEDDTGNLSISPQILDPNSDAGRLHPQCSNTDATANEKWKREADTCAAASAPMLDSETIFKILSTAGTSDPPVPAAPESDITGLSFDDEERQQAGLGEIPPPRTTAPMIQPAALISAAGKNSMPSTGNFEGTSDGAKPPMSRATLVKIIVLASLITILACIIVVVVSLHMRAF